MHTSIYIHMYICIYIHVSHRSPKRQMADQTRLNRLMCNSLQHTVSPSPNDE